MVAGSDCGSGSDLSARTAHWPWLGARLLNASWTEVRARPAPGVRSNGAACPEGLASLSSLLEPPPTTNAGLAACGARHASFACCAPFRPSRPRSWCNLGLSIGREHDRTRAMRHPVDRL